LPSIFIYLIFVSGFHSDTNEQWVHIDTFSAMNGISRFCESDSPWRYIIFYFLLYMLMNYDDAAS